jgi:hypothetical protein
MHDLATILLPRNPKPKMMPAAKIHLSPFFRFHLDCSGGLRDNDKDFLK